MIIMLQIAVCSSYPPTSSVQFADGYLSVSSFRSLSHKGVRRGTAVGCVDSVEQYVYRPGVASTERSVPFPDASLIRFFEKIDNKTLVDKEKMKYIVITGGVISGIGKGVIASSTGLLLKTIGLKVTAIKIDPYMNIDAGLMAPTEHGERS
jgi:hypothetical protein